MSDNDEMPDAATIQLVMKEAKDLVRALEGTGTSRVRISAAGLSIEVDRDAPIYAAAGAAAPQMAGGAGGGPASAPGMLPVLAPLVGVFYHAATPGAKPFVAVGDRVERGQVIGIVEAMKVMNEVTSDYRGVVAEILVGNGEAVQYEQRLMLLDTGGAE